MWSMQTSNHFPRRIRENTTNVRTVATPRVLQNEAQNANIWKLALIDVPNIFIGAPIGLQLVGKHFRDEETVAAADLVARIVQN